MLRFLKYLNPKVGFLIDEILRRTGFDEELLAEYRSQRQTLELKVKQERFDELLDHTLAAWPWLAPASLVLPYYAYAVAGLDATFISFFTVLFAAYCCVYFGIVIVRRSPLSLFAQQTIAHFLAFTFFTAYGFASAYYYPHLPLSSVIVCHMLMGGILAIASAITASVRILFPLLLNGCLIPVIVYFLFFQDQSLLRDLGYLTVFYYTALLIFNYADHIRRKYSTLRNLLLADLRDRVESKNQTLQNTNNDSQKQYAALQKIKDKQAGDYFLTALLLQPLTGQIESQASRIAGFSRQIKLFNFRDKRNQLGGDLNIVEDIIIGSEKFIFFTNADAQGSGMHGAAGAIIYATLIRSILGRTIQTQETPASWLSALSYEVNAAFLQFNGGMTVSFVCGLLGVADSKTYFLNAGHPEPVLYENGHPAQLNYLKSHTLLPEAGLEVFPKNIVVDELLLSTGQVLVIASDGRDKIIEGGRVNTKPARFIETIRQAGADPKAIYQALRRQGKIADDFSILCVGPPG